MRFAGLLLVVLLAGCSLGTVPRAFNLKVTDTSPQFGGPTLCVDGSTRITYQVAFRVPVKSWTVKVTTSDGRNVGSKSVEVAHSPNGLQPVEAYYGDSLNAYLNIFSQAITPVALPSWQLELEAIPLVPDPDRPGNIVIATGSYQGVRCKE